MSTKTRIDSMQKRMNEMDGCIGNLQRQINTLREEQGVHPSNADAWGQRPRISSGIVLQLLVDHLGLVIRHTPTPEYEKVSLEKLPEGIGVEVQQ